MKVEALVHVHAAVWVVPAPPARNPLRGSMGFTAGVVAFGASVWGARWVPGAVLTAVGVQALHLFTVSYLSPTLHHSTALYGVLGIVATVLFWLYLTGRLVVAAATLNASLHEQRLLAAGATAVQLPDAADPDVTIRSP